MVRSFVKFSASHSKSARDRRSGRDGRLDRDERPTGVFQIETLIEKKGNLDVFLMKIDQGIEDIL